MKRTVYNTMIGLMLASGLAITSTGALAQGRRPATSTNAAATGNRTSVASVPKSNAAVINNNSSVNRSSATTSVTSRSSSISTNINTGTTTNRSGSVNAGNRSSSVSTNVRTSTPSSNSAVSVRPTTSGNSSNVTTSVRQSNAGNRSANSGSSVSSVINNNSGGKSASTAVKNNNGNSSSVRPSGNSGTGHVAAPTSRPSTNKPRPKVGGTVLAGGGPKIDYSTFRYTSSWRPRFDGDRFFNHFRYNSWSWRAPIRPSVRLWRPTTMWIYRPIVTVNVSHYSSYPTIAGVLGLRWGTHYVDALNYLYYNFYDIDGYMDNIVYLNDVEMLGFEWQDVMMEFDGNDRLDYVEFSFWDNYYDTSRFYSLYNHLCSIYGSPVSFTNSMYSWYGGDGVGFVNLGIKFSSDVNYTVLAFGV